MRDYDDWLVHSLRIGGYKEQIAYFFVHLKYEQGDTIKEYLINLYTALTQILRANT